MSLESGKSSVSDADYVKWRKAGEISAAAIELGKMLVREGAGLWDVAEQIEDFMRQNGAEPAFPTNLSRNEVAAHYTPASNEKNIVFEKGDVVKLDLGAQIEGWIADTAVTIEVGTTKWAKLIDASKKALDEAIAIMGPNCNLSTVGGAIETVITSHGFQPIRNLTGHLIERNVLHAGISVPNVSQRIMQRPRIGQVFAIEPFATNGEGHVVSGPSGNIYHFQRDRPQRLPDARRLLQTIGAKYPHTPFAERWLARDGHERTNASIQFLLKSVAIKSYPQLIEAAKGMVAQHEHTVLITEDGCEVLTKSG
ncbi:MAG TPA: type II methionyl aminopeptidase [Candidatus Thermoplasmatota archaeon]|nr:type II methionyl aminopeptidase [Candidatus Thermoplasmatota archaeon]